VSGSGIEPGSDRGNVAIAWDLPDPFTIDLVVGEGDIDHLGHTNNTVYHVWCERVAWAHSAAVGLDPQAWKSLERAMAMRSSQALFLAPSFLAGCVRRASAGHAALSGGADERRRDLDAGAVGVGVHRHRDGSAEADAGGVSACLSRGAGGGGGVGA